MDERERERLRRTRWVGTCPKCGAANGVPCTGYKGQERKAAHLARWHARGIDPAEAYWRRKRGPEDG